MYLKSYTISTIKQVFIRWPKNIIHFFKFVSTFSKLRKINDGRFTLKIKDLYPCLKDKTTFTPVDQHYIYHPAWAARILAKTKPEYHVDISSILCFSTIVSAFIPIKFYDYRPAQLTLSNWKGDAVNLIDLPFLNNTIPSLSCLHTIEHIGLGRYGDPLDIKADIQAINELKRVLAPNGDLLFATPISGKPRIEYNAHRIYSYEQILSLFNDFELIEFSLIPDKGGLIENADPHLASKQQYGCGCFWFKKLIL